MSNSKWRPDEFETQILDVVDSCSVALSAKEISEILHRIGVQESKNKIIKALSTLEFHKQIHYDVYCGDWDNRCYLTKSIELPSEDTYVSKAYADAKKAAVENYIERKLKERPEDREEAELPSECGVKNAICWKCGGPIKEADAFCSRCGANQTKPKNKCASSASKFTRSQEEEYEELAAAHPVAHVISCIVLALMLVGIVCFFQSCSSSSSRYRGSEDRWNSLTPHQQEVAEQSYEYYQVLKEMGAK